MTRLPFQSIRSIIPATLLILLACTSIQCSKTDDEPEPVTPAFPEKYCGSFAFTVIDIYHNPDPTSDTSSYTGTISLLDRSTNTLEIRYDAGQNTVLCNSDSIWGAFIKPVVAGTGQLDYPAANSCGSTQPFSGRFSSTDTVTFSMTTGGFWYRQQMVKGVRIK